MIKSPKLSTLSITTSARPMQYALVIFVFKHISQFGPSKSACRHYAYPKLVPLSLETPLVIHVALQDYVHRPNSLWTPAANLASHAIDRFVLLRVLHVCVFGFFWFMLQVFSVAPHSYFHLFRVLGFSVYLLSSIQNPVMKMMMQVSELYRTS